MRMMNGGQGKISLDSSLKDDQTAGRAQEIEALKPGQCFILIKPKASLSLFTHLLLYFLVESFQYNDSSV